MYQPATKSNPKSKKATQNKLRKNCAEFHQKYEADDLFSGL